MVFVQVNVPFIVWQRLWPYLDNWVILIATNYIFGGKVS